MPTFDWLDREHAFRIAARVSTRVLRPHERAPSTVGDVAAGNLLVQGDNLEALAALLPFYRGRVRCIFIDPPYNTKSAFEHYDDILATIRHLVAEKRVPLEQLVRHQHTLAQRLEARIDDMRDRAAHAAFRQLVFDGGWQLKTGATHGFEFGAAYPVPANRRYDGKFRFAKHFYPVVANLKDGGEEWRCAQAIDRHPNVAHWVRNLDSDPVAGFWLPTSFGRFYPDFVCELTDGRLLVVEYKGAQIASMPKEVEKGEVGKLWAARSAGRCVFALVLKDREGLNVPQQLDAAMR